MKITERPKDIYEYVKFRPIFQDIYIKKDTPKPEKIDPITGMFDLDHYGKMEEVNSPIKIIKK